MKKISTLMRSYMDAQSLNERRVSSRLLPESFGQLPADLPIAPAATDWSLQYEPERLHRVYEFQNLSQRGLFVEELMALEERSGHYAKLTIEGTRVTVEVWTHDLNRVTELDQEYAGDCDVLFNDVSLIRFDGHEY